MMPKEMVVLIKVACRLGCSQADVARASGYSPGTIGLINGELSHKKVKVDWEELGKTEKGLEWFQALYAWTKAVGWEEKDRARKRCGELAGEILGLIAQKAKRFEEEKEHREREIEVPLHRRAR